ncbi:unnamed protein product [Spirodela intermedia]|uniref:Pectinesterase n=1 Tax=Spirodela intermedia TaxID=51605 RepID=A0A7I8KTI4_SPIIN|nr:unnamed protein product [Spirodela intermedia]
MAASSAPRLPRPVSTLPLLVTLVLFLMSPSPSSASAPTNTSLPTGDAPLTSIRALCRSTPHPDACFDSLKVSIKTDAVPSILSLVSLFIRFTIAEAAKISAVITSSQGISEGLRGSLQDCEELHQITLSSLNKCAAVLQSGRQLSDVRTHLSAALTNSATCLEGLSVASGPVKPILVELLTAANKHIRNSLGILPSEIRRRTPGHWRPHDERLIAWLSRRKSRLLQSGDVDDGYDRGSILSVAADGKGNFTTLGAAINFAPNNSADRTIIIVRAGVYEENVEVPSYKTNIVLLGDGSGVTIIRGRRSAGDGWTTFRSATVAVSGEGFLARDIAFDNAAGAAKGQASALRVNADLAAFYRCVMTGYQDTLYVHSFRQFYRECDIYGTIDFIFGNAAVVFQACNIFARMPIPGQANAIIAQGRDDPNQNTGISIQNCTILASKELPSGLGSTQTYLGRPWKLYSRTVYVKSYIDRLIDPAGWSEWVGDQGLRTLYFGEYANSGPGSATEERVKWPGYHLMGYDDAVSFTVSELISGDGWLESTSFPFDAGL